MAVVFISPKKKQKTFLAGMIISFIVFAVFLSLWVFLAQPNQVDVKYAINQPKVTLNFKIMDTDQFKSLELFTRMPRQFKYSALDSKGKTVRGYVSALSEDDARQILANNGLDAGELIEVVPGRDNPFIPYYSNYSTTSGAPTTGTPPKGKANTTTKK
jgi:hypothetical protein